MHFETAVQDVRQGCMREGRSQWEMGRASKRERERERVELTVNYLPATIHIVVLQTYHTFFTVLSKVESVVAADTHATNTVPCP